MPEPALFTAHIITSEAHALGDPGVIVMTREEDERRPGRVLDNVPLTRRDTVNSAGDVLTAAGWRPVRNRYGVLYDLIETGYNIVNVERI